MSTPIPTSPIVANNLFRFGNFGDVLRYRGETQGLRRIFTFLEDGESLERTLTYGELYRDSLAVARFLEERTMPGDRVLLLFPTGLDFIRAFLGTLLSNRVAVPLAPPDPSRLAQGLPQLINVMRDAGAAMILTDERLLGLTIPVLAGIPELSGLQTASLDVALARGVQGFKAPRLEDTSPALLLYTSGSSGDPKGITVLQQNLIQMTAQLHRHFHFQRSDTLVSWLPFYHNFGLVTSILDPLFFDTGCVFLSPLAFLQRPVRWLQAISRYRAAVSAGSNFAYELCVKQVSEAEKRGLDLSSWRFAVCGSEPVRPQTLQRFSFHFRSCGFSPESFYPGYGLSEATSVVSTRHRIDRLRSLTLSQRGLQKNLVTEPTAPEDRVNFLSCGRPLPSLELRIVNPETRTPCPAGQIGELWVRGPSVAEGYWRRNKDTMESFRAHLEGSGEGPYLRTGDLGFLSAGEIFITGRLKELIIVRGRNHYPSDIERTVEAAAGIKTSGGIAFSVDHAGKERLVILQELAGSISQPLVGAPPPSPSLLRRGKGEVPPSTELEALFNNIQREVSKNHGLELDEIALLPEGVLPRTRLGKLQRQACRQGFAKGEFPILQVWHRPETRSGEIPDSCPVPQRAEQLGPWMLSRLGTLLDIPAENINLDRPLRDYGLDSLRSVQIAQHVERELGIIIPVARLYEEPSVSTLIEFLKAEFREPGKKRPNAALDLRSEARLDPTLRFSRKDFTFTNFPSSIFLTGATGFLGAFLLEELLKKTQARIHCLVRAGDLLEGLERIRRNLEFFSLWRDEFLTRIQPVLGDLSRERFGLPEPEFFRLAKSIDSIFHNGANVNFLYSYRDLKPSNVLGTREILRLAAAAGTKPVYYVSTLSVFPTAGDPDGRPYTEDDSLDQTEGLLNGYAQSKWVAEKLLMRARERGLPTMIFRVGEVIGHSRTGGCRAERDAYSVLMKGAIEMQSYPLMELLLYFVPVDYACRAMVNLALRKENLGKAFHLTNPRAIHVDELFRLLGEAGFSCRGVRLSQWLEEIQRRSAAGERSSLATFIPFLRSPGIQRLATSRTLLKIDCRRTLAALTDKSIRCPPPGGELFQPYLRYLQHSGFLNSARQP